MRGFVPSHSAAPQDSPQMTQGSLEEKKEGRDCYAYETVIGSCLSLWPCLVWLCFVFVHLCQLNYMRKSTKLSSVKCVSEPGDAASTFLWCLSTDLLVGVNVVVDPSPLCGDGLQEGGVVIRPKAKGVHCAIKLLQKEGKTTAD